MRPTTLYLLLIVQTQSGTTLSPYFKIYTYTYIYIHIQSAKANKRRKNKKKNNPKMREYFEMMLPELYSARRFTWFWPPHLFPFTSHSYYLLVPSSLFSLYLYLYLSIDYWDTLLIFMLFQPVKCIFMIIGKCKLNGPLCCCEKILLDLKKNIIFRISKKIKRNIWQYKNFNNSTSSIILTQVTEKKKLFW